MSPKNNKNVAAEIVRLFRFCAVFCSSGALSAAYRRFETFSSRGRIDEIAAGRLLNAQPFERIPGKSHENRVFVYAAGLRTGRGFGLRAAESVIAARNQAASASSWVTGRLATYHSGEFPRTSERGGSGD